MEAAVGPVCTVEVPLSSLLSAFEFTVSLKLTVNEISFLAFAGLKNIRYFRILKRKIFFSV